MNLEALNKKEEQLLEQVHLIIGSMDEKTRQLKENGVFEAYRNIHSQYVSLAKAGSLEALKRALFIQWYAAVEPSCFTGIPSKNHWGDGLGLDEKTQKLVLDLATKSIKTDEELEWMAAWYYQVGVYYFNYFAEISLLLMECQKYLDTNPSFEQKITAFDFHGRGQMGNYFLSVQNSIANYSSEN